MEAKSGENTRKAKGPGNGQSNAGKTNRGGAQGAYN